MIYIAVALICFVLSNLYFNLRLEKIERKFREREREILYESTCNKRFIEEIKNVLDKTLKQYDNQVSYYKLMEELEAERNEQSFPTALDLSYKLQEIITKEFNKE
jgi:hypothetical protein